MAAAAAAPPLTTTTLSPLPPFPPPQSPQTHLLHHHHINPNHGVTGIIISSSTTKKKDGEGEEWVEWEPTAKGLLKYLVDSKVVFDTVEGVVVESEDVALAYFRNTGLERSSRIDMDLQLFREENMLIPEPSKAGLSYAKYLKELSKKSVPSFISHLYTIYFTRISGDQAILKQVAEKILDGRELEITKWDDDPQVLLRQVKDTFNKLVEVGF
ncbi:putative inactive heme oxygenase 2, chloroplastic [Drosera capensis]